MCVDLGGGARVKMKALVDRLSDELSERYVTYLETLVVDRWSEHGFIELRCGFSLRSDHVLESLTVKLPAAAGTSDTEREVLIRAVFEELEEQIDRKRVAEAVTA